MTNTGQLTIGRLHGEYLVPADHPNPQKVRARLDGALQNRLVPFLTHALQATLEHDEDGVWLIRHLDAILTLDLGYSDDQTLVEALGRQFAGTIQQSISHPPNGHNILYFEDKISYVAQFVIDLAAGRAWNRWYYAPFEGLRSLSTSQAIQAAILREPESVEAVLNRLFNEEALERVLDALTEADLERLYQASLDPGARGRPDRQAIDMLLDLWSEIIAYPTHKIATTANKMRFWLAWIRLKPGQEALRSQVAASIDLLLEFAELLGALKDTRTFLHALTGDQMGSAYALARDQGKTAGLEHLTILQELADGDLAWLEGIANVVVPITTPPMQASALTHTYRLNSRFTGLFLLLPTLLDLKLDTLLAANAPSESVAAIWRYWLALKCLGNQRLAESRYDPVVLTAMGLEAPPNSEETQEALAAASPERLAAIEVDFLAMLQTQDRADGRLLAREKVSLDGFGAPLGLLRDMRADYWVALTQNANPMDGTIQQVAVAFGQSPDLVWDTSETLPDGLPDMAPDYLHKAKPARPSLEYFHHPDLPAEVNLTFSLLAQATLRTFGRRLMGFAWSSPDHLYPNFLAGGGFLHLQPEGFTTNLGQPPLHTVLRMAGFGESEYEIPWLAALPVQLTFDQDV